MADLFGGELELDLDLARELARRLRAGVYLGAGVGGGARGGIGMTLRAGLDATLSFHPSPDVVPWLAYGVGVNSTGVGVSERSWWVDANGYDLADVSAGVQVVHSDGRSWGPFLEACVGVYHSGTDESGPDSPRTLLPIPPETLHAWLKVGLRVTWAD